MRFFIALVLALALAVMGCSETSGTGGSGGDGGDGGGGQGGTGGEEDPKAELLEDYADGYVADYIEPGDPGLAVALVGPNGVVFEKGYGMANVEESIPFTQATPCSLASVSKPFTATAAMILYEEGVLDPSDLIAETFPEAPDAWNTITLHHVLTHQSGIPDHSNDPNDLGADRSDEDVLAWALGQPLEFSPGSRVEYSNTGYVLIALLIERLTEQSFQSFLEQRIFAPLGMEDATVPEDEPRPSSIPGQAHSYAATDPPFRWPYPILLRTTGDRGQYSSVNDLKRFELALRTDTLVTAETMELMINPDGETARECGYGYGWYVCDQEGGSLDVGHLGSHFGFRTAFHRAPLEGVVSIMVSNGHYEWAHDLAYELHRLYLD